MHRCAVRLSRVRIRAILVLILICVVGPAWVHAADVERIQALAEQGDANAQWSLGTLYFTGDSVPQDYRQAYRWFRSAADHGHGLAQRSLGTMYRHGLGVPQDALQAYVWYSLGAMQGSERARVARDEVAGLLTDEQIVEAERRVLEWRPGNDQITAE